jgi:tetratricopeptide (TPR) repeat protein
MADREGPEKKTQRRRRRSVRRAPPPASGAANPSPPPGAATPPPPTNGEWAEIADRAAKKLSDLAEKARPAAEKAGETAKKVAVDLSEGLEGAFARITAQARDLMAKGQHTRVRIKFRGKQVAEVPIAAVAAAEVASFWWFGPLRVVLAHVVGKAVLEVEFVSNADQHVVEGRRWLQEGEMEKALAEFDKALGVDRRHAGAHLGRGIALKLRGDKASAREAFRQAEECDPRSEAGREARRHLDNL